MNYRLFKLLQSVELIVQDIGDLERMEERYMDMEDPNIKELVYCWNKFKSDGLNNS